MKVFRHFYILVVAVLLFLPGCYDTEDGSYVAPITLYEKIHGSWEITSVKQIDEIAKSKQEAFSEMTITSQFDFATFAIDLKVDGQNQPTTYTVSGTSPAFFPTEGYWELGYPFPIPDGTPSMINLYSDAGKTKKTGELTIVALPTSKERTLGFKFIRKAQGIPFVSYEYKLSAIEDDSE